MKKFIALTAILASTTAFATENLEFGDLNYFVKSGQFNVKADVFLSSYQYKQNSTKFEREGNSVVSDYVYGIMDNFNIYAGLDYDWDMQVANETANSSKYNQDGLRNPRLGANYRLLNQTDSAVNFDIGFLATINMQDQETGSSVGGTTKDGNATDGRTSYEVNTAIGRKWNEANEWRLSAGLIHRTEGERDQLVVGSNKVNVDTESSQDFFLRAAYQYRPVQEFMMSIAWTATQVGEYEENISSRKDTYDSHLTHDFTFLAKYLVTENFIAKFTLNQGLNPDYDAKFGGTNVEFKNIRDHYWGLGVDFLF